MKKNRGFTLGGFTLAEVLITLTIIGVVAALTIPSLLANVNDKTYEAKRKGFATRMAQAISQIGTINAYEAKPSTGSSEDPKTFAEENSSMNFITEGLSKVYKITNVCEFESFSACDFPDTWGQWNGSYTYYTKNYPKLNNLNSNANAENMGGILTKAAAFRTKNGESVLLWYNPRCVSEQQPDSENKVNWRKETCVFMMVDLDGAKKGPNRWGSDIHAGAIFYPDTPYFELIHTKFHAIAVSKPSYSDSTAESATAEKYCANWTNQGYSKGSYRLVTRAEARIFALLVWNYSRVWTNDVEGSGPDDYAWMMDGVYERLEQRKNLSTIIQCAIKERN